MSRKRRNGPVTNSSSTSYTCEISGESETFRDGCSHRDYGFMVCDNEHVILEEFALNNSSKLSASAIRDDILNAEQADEIWDYNEDDMQRLKDGDMTDDEIHDFYHYEVDFEFDIRECDCPICQMEIVTDHDLRRYLEKVHGIQDSEVLEDIKSRNKRRKKVYAHEYIDYVIFKFYQADKNEATKEFKEKFSSYSEFKKFMRN